MSRVLVVGDAIWDRYRYFTATRICPEAPVPVLVETCSQSEREGGAGLVRCQLEELLGERQLFLSGSNSIKERLFADGHMVARIDQDSKEPHDGIIERAVINLMKKTRKELKALVISDYGKGTFTQPMAERVVRAAKILDITVFVDAKHNWSWYKGADFAFPNQHETVPAKTFKHVIQKLGDRGCMVDGELVPTTVHAVRDTCGAGDVFLAAFVALFLHPAPANHHGEHVVCARFANRVAGKSCEFVGTHVVTKEEL